jgi:hypothetical protein
MPTKASTLTDPDVVSFLLTLHPFVAHQFVIGVFAEWAKKVYADTPGVGGAVIADRSFLLALRRSLDSRLVEPPPRQSPSSHKEPSLNKPALSKRERAAVVATMETMHADVAIGFLADIAASWALAMPVSQAHLMSVVPRDSSPQAFADAVLEWFTRYFDLWK